MRRHCKGQHVLREDVPEAANKVMMVAVNRYVRSRVYRAYDMISEDLEVDGAGGLTLRAMGPLAGGREGGGLIGHR